ncbi:polyadenylate-binding protein-interacting protein 1 [Megalops cyprinoides]|uniref:polyadenylate-binding protein-interacting protein 1 n=1 Tax=Megalops cyprinoides TaxID=118141 RepID=UPI00186549AB|nr:polyadenylate-binding protein-interacting protein 1 [Megalops cyprinoides]
MTDYFDRAPGAGRVRLSSDSPGLAEPVSGRLQEGDANVPVLNQREPLRQPRTSPPVVEDSLGGAGEGRRLIRASQAAHNSSSGTAQALNSVVSSNLSVNAAEFYPSGYNHYQEEPSEDGYDGYYPETLAELVQGILGHLTSSPGSFEADIEQITDTLNAWVTTEETLQELVELIYTQSTSITNFSYTGARLCNHLSRHLALSPSSGNFRQRLLQRCRTEYEQRDQAVKGDEATRKSFHSYVVFLGELYLNLEVNIKGPLVRADILLTALRDLMDTLLSNPDDGNLICAVKLLKLTGLVLEDTWKEKGKPDMDELVMKIKAIVLDASRCSRDVRETLLKLVELRSSDWGRVQGAVAAREATPYNDPNYFMNEPTFYTADGTPFTAADPEYSEKYQEILDREDYFPDYYEENGNEGEYDYEDEMDPEMEEAYERFCLESQEKRKQ